MDVDQIADYIPPALPDFNFEEEIEFRLINDPHLKVTMEDPMFTDFYIVTGAEKTSYSVNLTLFSLFSVRVKDLMKKSLAEHKPIERIHYNNIKSLDFKLIHTLFSTGEVVFKRSNVLNLLRLCNFFEIRVLTEFLIEFIENNENFIDKLELFLFALESNSKYLMNIALNRIHEMDEEPFFSDRISKSFSEEALKKLLSKMR